MNPFYQTKKTTQWLTAIIMGLVLLLCLMGWVLLDNFLLKLGMVFILVPVYLLLATPIMTLTKLYNYVSPMLLYLKKEKEVIELHNGTSFDYLFQIGHIKPGRKWKNKMLQFYIEGLLELIVRIKNNEIPETATIKGTTYFVENSVVKKLGFSVKEPDAIDRINFVIGYLDLIWMHSLSSGKLQFPGYKKFKNAEISGENLLKSENVLIMYNDYFFRKTGDVIGA